MNQRSFVISLFFSCCLLPAISGCGSITGLPGHGGGKRFAVEQELVSAATRGAIKQLDLSSLKGKKVNLFVSAIGDTGAGNLFGGRYSFISQLRGDYVQAPPTVGKARYPNYSSTTSSTSSGTSAGVPSTSTSQSVTDTLLPSPSSQSSRQQGGGGVAQVGVEYKGLGAYQNSEEITSDDIQYLTALLQSYLFLNNVYVVPPSEAEVDVYVTVDVFGTVRTRVDWLITNNEILKAKTAMEIMAVDHITGALVLAPQTAGGEAEYNEKYWFWVGLTNVKKSLNAGDQLLSDFSDLPD